jgi:predicted PurR-regulated permease PerM
VPTRALTWAIFVAAAGVVAAVCVAILCPFANVIAWSAVLAILCYPRQEALVRRTGRAALSACLTSIVTVLVVAGRVGLSELAVFFALLGGLSAFAALGVVVGPLAFVKAAAIAETLRQPPCRETFQ